MKKPLLHSMLLIAICLVGCSATPNEKPHTSLSSQPNSQSAPHIDNDINLFKDSVNAITLDGELHFDFSSADSSTKDGYYFFEFPQTGGSLINYIDYAQNVKTTLCSQLSCAHTSQDCNAYFENTPAIICTNNNLVYLVKDLENKTQLFVADLSGNNKKKLLTIPKDLEINYATFSYDNSNIYCLASTITEQASSEAFLYQINITSGEMSLIGQVDNENVEVFMVSAYENKIVLKTISKELADYKKNNQISQEEWDKLYKSQQHKLYLLDLKTQAITMAKAWQQEELSEYYIGNEMYYIDQSKNVHEYSFDTEQDTVLSKCLNDIDYDKINIRYANKDFIYFFTSVQTNDDVEFHYYAYDIKSEALTKILLNTGEAGANDTWIILDCNWDKLLVNNSFFTKTVSLEGKDGTQRQTQVILPNYATVSISDFVKSSDASLVNIN